jgi:hypothetical protein
MRQTAHDLAQAARLIELSIGKTRADVDNALSLALATVRSAARIAAKLAETERKAAADEHVIDP